MPKVNFNNKIYNYLIVPTKIITCTATITCTLTNNLQSEQNEMIKSYR